MDNVHVCYYGNSPELKKILRLYDFIDLQANPDYQFQPNHRYLIMGPEAYKVIVEHQRIHLGPRREGFYDIQKMDYLRTRNGIIFKFVYVRYSRAQNWITKQQYETMLPHLEQIQQKFKDASLKEIHSKRTGKDYWLFEYKTFADLNDDCSDFLNKDDYVIADPPHVDYYKIVRTKEDIKNSMEYFINQDKGRRFGYDFETCHGFPFDNQYFEPMGLGIADLDGICAYFDIEYYRHCTDYYPYFLNYLKRFLDKHGDQVYTYNVGFELRVTYLMLHEMYPFQDAAAINKLEGDVAYNLTLKYTAMRHCHVASWDDSFEEMQEYLGSLMNSPGQHFDLDTYNPNMRAWTLENYDQSDDWAYLMEHYGKEESEFRRLIKQSWGDCFGAIPSNILGKYCCQDAYYTLLIRQRSDELGYTDDAWNCFSHNLRLGAHLNIDGCFVNHEEFEFQHYVCHTINAYGVLNLTYLVADIELEKLQDISIEDIPEVTGIMKFGCNFLDSKSLMRCLQDNQFEAGFNTDKAVEIMGQDLVDFIINQLKDWDRYPMQDGLFRARRFWEVLDDNLRKRWNVEIGDKEITLRINDQHYVIDKNIDRITYKYRLLTTTREIEYYLAQCDPNTPIKSMVSPTGEVIAIENFLHMYEWLINFNSAEVFKEFICNYYMRMWDVIYLARDEDHFLENLEKNEYPHLEFKDLKQYYKINNTLHVVKYVRFMDRILFDKIINKCTKLNSDLVAKCKLMMPDENSDNDDWWVSQAQKNAYISEQDVIYYNQCKVIIQCCKDYRVHKNELLFANRLGNHNEIILKVLDLKKPDHYGEEEAKIPFSINNTLYAMLDRLRGYYTLAYETELKWVSKAYIVGIYWDLDDWNQTQEFYKKIPTFDIREKSFRGLAKYAWCYYSMRKYNKVLTTYIDGMMTDTARYCAEYDDNGVGAKRWEGSGPMWKAFPHYDVCQKKSKRLMSAA